MINRVMPILNTVVIYTIHVQGHVTIAKFISKFIFKIKHALHLEINYGMMLNTHQVNCSLFCFEQTMAS